VRQGQQNRRGRGRNNNNRKGHHNPLARSFESNGPDVKIRGTPSHIAEKYIALARDAQSSGDPVLAENYLQHAEHYSRIIMAYREQLNPGDGMNGGGQRMRGPGDASDGEFGDDDGAEGMADDGFPQPAVPQQMPPMQQGRPQGGGEHHRHDRQFRRDHGRHRERYNDRGDRGDRDRQHGGPSEHREPMPQQERTAEAGGDGDPRRRDRFQPQHEQPDFLRRPVRRARTEEGESGKDD
jgi:hypothetical protein